MIKDFNKSELELIVPPDAIGDLERYKRLFHMYLKHVMDCQDITKNLSGSILNYQSSVIKVQLEKREMGTIGFKLKLGLKPLSETEAFLYIIISRFDMFLFSRIEKELTKHYVKDRKTIKKILRDTDVFRELISQHNKLRQKILGRPLGLFDFDLEADIVSEYVCKQNELGSIWANKFNNSVGVQRLKDLLYSRLSDYKNVYFDYTKFLKFPRKDLDPFVYFRLIYPNEQNLVDGGYTDRVYMWSPLPLMDIVDLNHKMDSTRENLAKTSLKRRNPEVYDPTPFSFRYIKPSLAKLLNRIDQSKLKMGDLNDFSSLCEYRAKNLDFDYFENRAGGFIGPEAIGWITASVSSDKSKLHAELVMTPKSNHVRNARYSDDWADIYGFRPSFPLEKDKKNESLFEDWSGQLNDENKDLFWRIILEGRDFLDHVFNRYPAHPLYMLMSPQMMRSCGIDNSYNRNWTLYRKALSPEPPSSFRAYEKVDHEEVKEQIFDICERLLDSTPWAIGIIYEYAITFRKLFEGRLLKKEERLRNYIDYIIDPRNTADHGYVMHHPYDMYRLRYRLFPLTHGFPLLLINHPQLGTVIMKTDLTPWSEYEKKRYVEILSHEGFDAELKDFPRRRLPGSSLPGPIYSMIQEKQQCMKVDMDWNYQDLLHLHNSGMGELFKTSEKFWQLYQQCDEFLPYHIDDIIEYRSIYDPY